MHILSCMPPVAQDAPKKNKKRIGTNGPLGEGNCHFPSSTALLIHLEDRLYNLFFTVTDLAITILIVLLCHI